MWQLRTINAPHFEAGRLVTVNYFDLSSAVLRCHPAVSNQQIDRPRIEGWREINAKAKQLRREAEIRLAYEDEPASPVAVMVGFLGCAIALVTVAVMSW